MRLTETCACGASVQVETATASEATAYVAAWRLAHLCPARHAVSEKLGFDVLTHKKDA